MRRVGIAAMMVCLAAAPMLRADMIDDAEAKKRGVSVEVVQLEHARARIVELEKRVAMLEKELADQKRIAGATTEPAQPVSPPSSKNATADEDAAFNIKQAIQRHGIETGMTLAQVKQSIGKYCDLKLTRKEGDVQEYDVWDGAPEPARIPAGEPDIGFGPFIAFKIKVSKSTGKVISWMDHHSQNR